MKSEGMGVLRALWHALSTDRVGRRDRNPHQVSREERFSQN